VRQARGSSIGLRTKIARTNRAISKALDDQAGAVTLGWAPVPDVVLSVGEFVELLGGFGGRGGLPSTMSLI